MIVKCNKRERKERGRIASTDIYSHKLSLFVELDEFSISNESLRESIQVFSGVTTETIVSRHNKKLF